nr:mabinlin II chain B - Yunnan caper (fragments) [Capparis masaikai]
QCCNQLRQVDRPCVCPVLRNLPNICNIPNIGACPFR